MQPVCAFISRPFRSATICTYGKAKLSVAAIVTFAILYNVPRFFEVSWNTTAATDDTEVNNENDTEVAIETEPQVGMSSIRSNRYYISIYITWMYLVFMYVLPFGGLSVLNMLIFLDVRYYPLFLFLYESHTAAPEIIKRNERKLCQVLLGSWAAGLKSINFSFFIYYLTFEI